MSVPGKISKYEIREPLGQGAVGAVYKGYQADLDRHVAIKVMIAGEHASEPLIRRFMREARAAASLAHPGIVQIHDIGAQESLHYIVMEWVDGGSLADLVEAGPVDPAEALRLCLRVAEALQEAHEKEIIHRDIKPSNILLDAKRRPKIADFGLAVSLEEDERLTRTGDILGTPCYMSPEQAFGSPDELDARTDVYSLGAVLYELLTGRPPFDGASAFSILKRIELEEPAPPSSARPELPKAIDRVVLKALEKDPARRYGSAGEFAGALRTALKESFASREPAGRRKSLRPVWGAAIAGGFLLGALFLILLAANPTPGGRPEERTPAAASVERVRGLVSSPAPAPDRAERLGREIQDLEAHLATHPSDGEAYHWLSRALLEAGAPRRAAEAASRALQHGYDVADARLQRLTCVFVREVLVEGQTRIPYLAAKPSVNAEAEFARVKFLNPSPAELALADGLRLAFAQKLKEAGDRVKGVSDRRAGAVRRYATPDAGPPGATLPEIFLAALAAAERGDEPGALRLTDGLLSLGPRPTAEAFLCRAAVLERLGKFEGVQEALRIARATDPADPFPLLYSLAVKVSYQKDLEADPGRVAGELLQEMGPVLSKKPAGPAPHVFVGIAHLVQGNRKLAEDAFAAARERALPFSGKPPPNLRPANIGSLLSASGARFLLESGHLLMQFRLPGAEPAVNEALERASKESGDPKRLKEVRQQAYLLLAAMAVAKNLYEEAASRLRLAIEEGLTLDDLKRDPRFTPVLDDPRHLKALTSREPASGDGAKRRKDGDRAGRERDPGEGGKGVEGKPDHER